MAAYNRTCVVRIPADDAQRLQVILDARHPVESDEDTLAVFRGDFGDGWEADVIVCNGEPPLAGAVLYRDGNEIQLLMASGRLVDDYRFAVANKDGSITRFTARVATTAA